MLVEFRRRFDRNLSAAQRGSAITVITHVAIFITACLPRMIPYLVVPLPLIVSDWLFWADGVRNCVAPLLHLHQEGRLYTLLPLLGMSNVCGRHSFRACSVSFMFGGFDRGESPSHNTPTNLLDSFRLVLQRPRSTSIEH